MWRASMASSRAVTCIVGSGRPVALVKFDLVRPSSRARLVIISANFGFAAGDALGQHDAGVVAGLDDHRRAAGLRPAPCCGSARTCVERVRRRAAVPPGILADDEFVVELELALLEPLNTSSAVISLARLDGGVELVGALLEQDGAAFGVDQDRVRRLGLEFVLLDAGDGIGRRRRHADQAGERDQRGQGAMDVSGTDRTLNPGRIWHSSTQLPLLYQRTDRGTMAPMSRPTSDASAFAL